MRVVVGQRQTEHQGVGPQHFLELGDDGNGTAFADENGVAAKGLFQRRHARLGQFAVGRNHVWLRAMSGYRLQTHGRRTDFFEMFDN